MKKRIFLFNFLLIGLIVLISGSGNPKQDQYIIIGWNDLGMHCSNKDFSKIAILPPFNNLFAHVIKRGTPTSMPEKITDGLMVSYEIPGNTYSVGKTNFWDYEDQIFGVNLPDNIGLTGLGLTGEMLADNDHFVAEGIPITPYADDNLTTEDPYQMALMKVFDSENTLLAETQNVIPVSNEISCVSSGCHSSETEILFEHEREGGFDPTATPILCANCHGSNALGLPGNPRYGSLSYVIHEKHADETNDCYKCHPGQNTQCHRGIMHERGMVCQDCHGNVRQVAQSIEDGREPWLEEPQCGATQCHGPNYAEEPGLLFRQSKGHAGLYCSTCHGSPHAIFPSTLDRDNYQNISLQGYEGILNRCLVCHVYDPLGAGPHGVPWTDIDVISLDSFDAIEIMEVYPNPATIEATIPFRLADAGKVTLDIIDNNGKLAKTLINQRMNPGEFNIILNVSDFGEGIYFCKLSQNGQSSIKKIVLLN